MIWDEESIQKGIKMTISESDLSPKDAFTTLYRCLLDRRRGPKLAPLLVELGQGEVLALLEMVK